MAKRKPPRRLKAESRSRSGSRAADRDDDDDLPEKTFPRQVLSWALLAGIWCAILAFFFLAYCALTLPNLKEVSEFRRKPMVLVLAADGKPIAEYGERSAAPISLKDMPPHLVNAVLATEDRRFYSHFGFDPIGLVRGVVINPLMGKRTTGGSTITQQLAKNMFLTPERAVKRKVQELLLAIWLEYTYTKDQILEAYLNRVYFGAGAYGVEAAAHTYFGKSVSDINVREAALLAGLLKAPSRYSPKSDPDEAAARTKVVLAAMQEAGFLNDTEMRSLKRLPPMNKQRLAINGEGRYFTDWIVSQAQEMVGDLEADIVITTTLDRSLQHVAETTISGTLDRDGAEQRASQAAAVLLSNDGAVRAMVGGRDYQDSQFNRATQALRQPGSSFKPFVYLAALRAGYTPQTEMEDTPRRYGKWSPENYDGKYHGTVTLAEALAQSYNTIAVALLDQVGVERVRREAQRLGITTDLPANLSLALGSGDVTPYELTAAYAALANGGRAVAPYAIVEIRKAAPDKDGEVLYRHKDVSMPQVTDANAVATLTGMMEGVVTHGTGKAAMLDRDVAGKTGTSSDYRDAWFAGFTHDHTLVVWLGNDDNKPMRKVTGGGLPARMWHDIMAAASRDLPAQALNTQGNGGFFTRLFSSDAPPSNDNAPQAEPVAARSSDEPETTTIKPTDSGLSGVLGRVLGGEVEVKREYPQKNN